jgi:hypothetical protein
MPTLSAQLANIAAADDDFFPSNREFPPSRISCLPSRCVACAPRISPRRQRRDETARVVGGGALDALRSCGELRGLREENEARVYGRAEAEDRRDGNNARNGSGTGREVEGLRGGRVRP